MIELYVLVAVLSGDLLPYHEDVFATPEACEERRQEVIGIWYDHARQHPLWAECVYRVIHTPDTP